MPRVILILLVFVITLFALLKCIFSKKDELPMSMPKAFWVGIILLLSPLGGLAFLIMSWVKKAENNSPDGEIPKPKNVSDLWKLGKGQYVQEEPKPPAPKSPDDDPDYLFALEAKIARKEFKANPVVPANETPRELGEDSDEKAGEKAGAGEDTVEDTVEGAGQDDKPDAPEEPDKPSPGDNKS